MKPTRWFYGVALASLGLLHPLLPALAADPPWPPTVLVVALDPCAAEESERIGMIAFSRTGMYAVRLMADDPDYLAALNISDAAIPGYMLHMLAHGVDEYERQLQSISGGAPRHVGYGRWFDGNPLYKLGSISTPTRIETIGWTSLIAMWELFAILR